MTIYLTISITRIQKNLLQGETEEKEEMGKTLKDQPLRKVSYFATLVRPKPVILVL